MGALAEAERDFGPQHPVVTSIKAAVAVGSTSNASALASPGSVEATFLESLRPDFLFDGALSSMRPVPLNLSRVIVISQGVVGYSVGEAAPKPISRMSVSGDDLTPSKVAATVILSRELVSVGVSQALYVQELRGAVGVQTDAGFATILAAGAPSFAIGGNSAIAFFASLSDALDALKLSAASRIFMGAHPNTVKALAMLTDSSGARVFPDLGVRGGMIADITVIATDGVDTPDTSGGSLILFDAHQIAANAGTVAASVSHQATVQLDDQPTDPADAAAVMVSLWQENLTGVRVERVFTAHKLRSTAAAIVTGFGAAA